MKKTIKLMAMVLCVASMMTFLSCTKGPDASRNANANVLVGEWRCTWSTALGDYGIQENEYVGTIWKFDAPAPVDNLPIIGHFRATINATYPEGETGEYHFYDEGVSRYPRLMVWVSYDTQNDKFYPFHGFHEDKPGDSFKYTADYSMVLTGNALTLYKYDEAASNTSNLTQYLKFTKVQ